jgi:hypothetical protein
MIKRLTAVNGTQVHLNREAAGRALHRYLEPLGIPPLPLHWVTDAVAGYRDAQHAAALAGHPDIRRAARRAAWSAGWTAADAAAWAATENDGRPNVWSAVDHSGHLAALHVLWSRVRGTTQNLARGVLSRSPGGDPRAAWDGRRVSASWIAGRTRRVFVVERQPRTTLSRRRGV